MAEAEIDHDIDSVKDNTAIVLGYGMSDVQSCTSHQIIQSYDSLMKSVEWGNFTQRVRVGIMMLPSQRNFRRNKCVSEINNYLTQRCRGTDIQLINSNLGLDDLAKDGVFLNRSGKLKMAKSIRNFAEGATTPRV